MNDAIAIDNWLLGARQWLPAAVAFVLLLGAAATWSYFKSAPRSGWSWLAWLFKVAAVAALAFCLVEPMRRTERPKPGANVMAILVDDSRSMQMKPPGAASSRIELLRGTLASDTPWQSRLAQDFDVRRYAFGSRMRASDDLSQLDFSANHSSLAGSLDTLRVRFSQRPVAGVILLSDGLATDDVEAILATEDVQFPVYPIVTDTQQEVQDLALDTATVSLSSFELAPATVEAGLQAVGLAGEEVIVRLLDEAGETLEQQQLSIDTNDFQDRVRFQYRPRDTGFHFVRLRALLKSEDQAEELTSSRREVTLENNQRWLAVDRGGGPYRILYVAGRPNWEFKFLRRALEEDIELELHGLLRIAKKEPKFSFRDREVDTTNPLMAGFSDDAETTEQYDEPVLVRLGVSEDELTAGFPSGQEDLYHYHAIILDDIEASFFTQQQMLLMRNFVAERGGGLMMLGGQETFVEGQYDQTPMGDVLPVYTRSVTRASKEDTVRYELTREGALEPWLRLRDNLADEKQRSAQMPEFLTWNEVSGTKPGASTLAALDLAGDQAPGLVTHRFGQGRVLAFLVGDFWRWGMRRVREDSDDLAQTWRQMARWLTSDVPKRTEVDVAVPGNPMDPHVLTIRLRDAAFKPLDNATVELKVTEPDGQVVNATLNPDATRPGIYTTEYWSRKEGGYRCQVRVSSADGQELPTVDSGWVGDPARGEFQRVTPDLQLLSRLAEKTGGEVVSTQDLNAFVSNLPTDRVPITETRIEPIWHRPWFVLLAIGCLCLEWGIRRWKGLP